MPIANNKVNFQYGTQPDYDKLSIKDNNTIYITTDTKRIYIGNELYSSGGATVSAATQSTDGLMSAADKTKLDTQVLTKTDLTIRTATEYANMTTVAGTLYLVIDGTSGNQTFTLKDSLGNIIPPYVTSASNGGSSNINTTSVTPNGGNIISSTALVGTVTNLETT